MNTVLRLRYASLSNLNFGCQRTMNIELGKYIKQPGGHSAFVLHPFPPDGLLEVPSEIFVKCVEAAHLVGKLDGVKSFAPDIVGGFLMAMLLKKDATDSSQIEGTRADLEDTLVAESGGTPDADDTDDITYYVDTVKYGLERMDSLPMSLRLIREIHKELMIGASSTHYADPGQFRQQQVRVGSFTPPPATEMMTALGDFEKFLNEERALPALIHIGIAHAQFETIHPFLDGNGRVGRILITLLLRQRGLLEQPLLFLSSAFRRRRQLYYQKLNDYHNGNIESWTDFFLDGVIAIAKEFIEIFERTNKLRDEDMAKIGEQSSRTTPSNRLVLDKLFERPVVTSKIVMDWTGFTRANAQAVIERFVKLGILEVHDTTAKYGRNYIYRRYVDLFVD